MSGDTMTLTITTLTRRFSVDLSEDECARAFNKIIRLLSHSEEVAAYDPKPLSNALPSSDELDETLTAARSKLTTHEPEPVIDRGWDNASVHPVNVRENRRGYKGFLYVECGHCNSAFGFNAKVERSSFLCRTCNKETKLTNMVPLYVSCKCGRSFRYRTNAKKECVDLNCIGCGAPATVEYAEKKGAYETVR